jgi:hypothetical protein
MQVTKDIVNDLLPVYLAGEASADTRAAVEAYLAEDLKLRETVDAARTYAPPPVEAPAGLEVRSLERTRRLLGRKNVWLGFALIFSFVPLILKPLWLGDLVMLIGLLGWAAFLVTCKKLAATGLEAPRRMGSRTLWAVVGVLLGAAVGHLIDLQGGWHRAMYDLPLGTSLLTLWLGEKFHQIPTSGELSRPITLFGKGKRS